MDTQEAAEYLGYSPDYIGYLCRHDVFKGVRKLRGKAWIIPKQLVIDYKPGLRGFAVKQAKKRAEAEKALAERNAAIRAAKGLPPKEKKPSPRQEEPEYVTVEEAAEILHMAKRTVRSYCLSRRIAGARKMDKRGKGWLIPKASLDNVLPGVGIISEDGQVMPLGRGKDAEV